MNNLKVQKNNWTIEDFDRTKIKRGILNSGTTEEQAEIITGQIESWAASSSTNGIIRSVDIKTKLLEIIGGFNPRAKTSFENFKKTKK